MALCSPSTMRFAMSHEAPSLTMAAFSQPRLLIATRADGGTHTGCLTFAHAQQIDAHRSVVTGGNDHQISTIVGTKYSLITRSAPESTSEHSWKCMLTRAQDQRDCPRDTSMPSHPSRTTEALTCSTLRSTHLRPSRLGTTCRASRLSPNARTPPYRHICAESDVTSHACAFSSKLNRSP